MKEIRKSVNWKGQSGDVKLDIIIKRGVEKYSDNINADGHIVAVDKTRIVKSNELTIHIADKVIDGLFVDIMAAKNKNIAMALTKTVNDKISTIGITDNDVADKIKTAVAEAEAEAEKDIDYAEILKSEKEVDEYYNHINKVDKMMTLNGHTY